MIQSEKCFSIPIFMLVLYIYFLIFQNKQWLVNNIEIQCVKLRPWRIMIKFKLTISLK